MSQAEPQESLLHLHLQRMLEITRRFFEVEAAERRPRQRGGRSYPVPLPGGWCLREDAERNRWYHKEYPYRAAARQAD
jgi:hypothetical protein